MLSDKMIDYTE